MKIELIGLVICLLGISQAKTKGEGAASQLMIRSAYCACRCCEKNEGVCFRHESIPSTFKCSESMCNDKYCEAWAKAKCQKDCFCEVCRDQITEYDFRCVSYTGVPDECECDQHMTCDFAQKPPNEIEEGVKQVSALVDKPQCVAPCFCKKCRDSLPLEIYGDCLMSREKVGECDCGDLNCPVQTALDELKKVRKLKEKEEKSGAAYSFSKEIDEMMEPDKAKDVKCRMQCFCDICSVRNAKIEGNCDQMLPKPRVEGCKCNPDDVKCPSEDIDQHCKIYCFCKGCSSDPNMPEKVRESCKEMTKKDQACMCADEEDCSLLKELPGATETPQKKKNKKGKLKPKKKDEL